MRCLEKWTFCLWCVTAVCYEYSLLREIWEAPYGLVCGCGTGEEMARQELRSVCWVLGTILVGHRSVVTVGGKRLSGAYRPLAAAPWCLGIPLFVVGMLLLSA